MATLTNKDIENLIEIGQYTLDEITNTNLIDNMKDKSGINVLHTTEWQSKIASYSDSDIIYLFKGLVLVERELQWTGGSVAAAIWVYRTISERSLDKDKQIAAFAVKYCYNTYVPFGQNRVLFGWENGWFHSRRIPTGNYNSDKVSTQREEIRSLGEREREIGRLRELSYEERGRIRKELLKKYLSSSVSKRLEIITNDKIYPPEYYPYEWVKISDDEIQKLPVELIKRLHDKLSRNTKGEWKRFVKKLKKYDDGT